MKKIPTLFKRDPDDMRRVLPEVTPGCEWVLAGEGTATRKYDGTCVMYDGDEWWARREVKPGKAAPMGYVPISTDENTGKTVGWEPMAQSAFSKFHVEALGTVLSDDWKIGTYELCGPKINRNPERYLGHTLVPHDEAQMVRPFNLTFDGLRESVLLLHKDMGVEGIVWHHPDGRMAKLKARDFPESR